MDEAVKNALGVDICVGHVFMGRVGTRGVKDGSTGRAKAQ